MTDKRRKAEQRGRRAEKLAKLLLRLKGYRILFSRYRCPVGEIDLVATDKGTLVCIEVKLRRSLEDAAASLTRRQQNRIVQAAELLRASLPNGAKMGIRFDLIALAPKSWPRHIKSAWRPDP